MLSDQEITAIWNEAMNKAESIALNKSQTMELLREISRRTQSEGAVRTEGVRDE